MHTEVFQYPISGSEKYQNDDPPHKIGKIRLKNHSIGMVLGSNHIYFWGGLFCYFSEPEIGY